MNWKCNRCGYVDNLDTSARCARCHYWQTSVKAAVEGIVQLSQVDDAEEDRVKTGPWDICFGGGIVRDSLTMLGGRPGAGKSTLMLQIAEEFTIVENSNVLYINCEESKEQIKSRANRLCIETPQQEKILTVKQSDLNLDSTFDSIDDLCLVILDSLPGLVGIGPASYNDGINVLRNLKDFTDDRKCPVIVVEHVTQELGLAGLMAYQHLVDTTILFYPESDEEIEAPRILKTLKNRHGPAFVKRGFAMTGNGLMSLQDKEEKKGK